MAVSAERVLRALDRRHRPLVSPRELLHALGASRRDARALAAVLRGLVREGRLERHRGRYRIARPDALREGVFEAGGAGPARVVDDEGVVWEVGEGSAHPGERVLFETLAPRSRPGAAEAGDGGVARTRRRAAVVRPIGGPRPGVVGVIGADGVVRPWREDPRGEPRAEIRVRRDRCGTARPGDVVEAVPLAARARAPRAARGARRPRARGRRAAGRGSPRERVEAAVAEVVGPLGTPEADFRAIVWRHRLPVEFAAAVLDEADALPAALSPAELARRRDLRAHPFLTIDPATARDHDDAVFVEAHGRGHRLWVAIADVAYYVPEASALDAEARRRGNSVYFPDRAIPMLPERLSGELCSLRPGVDRLALAVELEVDAQGAVGHRRFHEAVIRSRARLVYDDAARAMEGSDEPPPPLDPDVREQLARLADVARRLTRRRFAAGAIDFDLPTAEIVLGDAGHPTDIVEAPRTLAHRAIEEAMLAANRAVAEALLEWDLPAIFRVHEPPLPEQLEALRELLASFGLLEGRTEAPLGPGEIARAIQRAAGRPEERLVNSVTLRALRQARYDASNRGHFALAFDAYLHFTSPIRRYADLVVHRQLRDALAGTPEARARARARGARFPAWGASLSWCERTAMDAERDAVDLKKCVFLRDRIGEAFDGTVTRTSRHGLHVTLDPFFVEGLVPVRTLPGAWDYDEEHFAWRARRGGARLRLGDRVRVRVARVDLERAWIDFALEPAQHPPPSSDRRRPVG
jgi:ribonuclease R